MCTFSGHSARYYCSIPLVPTLQRLYYTTRHHRKNGANTLTTTFTSFPVTSRLFQQPKHHHSLQQSRRWQCPSPMVRLLLHEQKSTPQYHYFNLRFPEHARRKIPPYGRGIRKSPSLCMCMCLFSQTIGKKTQ